MIAKKTFIVKIGGVSYQVPAGRKIPGAVLDHWQTVNSPMLAENADIEVKKEKKEKPAKEKMPEMFEEENEREEQK